MNGLRFQYSVGVFVFFMMAGVPGLSIAQDAEVEPVHWAYSSFFGTGWYQVESARSVFVLRVPPRQTLRESGFSDSGERKIGVEIHYPVTLGLHNIDNLPGLIEPDNFGTASFTPGVVWEIPVNERWYLRPSAHLGWGTDLRSDESAWIYYAGVKSQYSFPRRKFDWYLHNSLYFAGYTPDKGKSDRLAVARIGVELRQPLSEETLVGSAMGHIHWTLMYSFMGNELHFDLPEGHFDPIDDQFEAGVALSFRKGPFKLWFIPIHSLGLGYKFSSNGQFKAITLTTRTWFTR